MSPSLVNPDPEFASRRCRPCREAHALGRQKLADVRDKLADLRRIEWSWHIWSRIARTTGAPSRAL